jgi:CubicO group peptidase (beta-lactamase class C family)
LGCDAGLIATGRQFFTTFTFPAHPTILAFMTHDASPGDLKNAVDSLVREQGFSGVVRVDRGGDVVFSAAYGLADRAHRVPNNVDTRFAIASGTKGLTALVIVSLVVDGVLELSTTVRSFLREDLPLIGDDVTVFDLLSHRSGIGDYLDEDLPHDINDYLMPAPVHELDATEAYLKVLAGHPAKFPRGTRFSYCNSGYVVLALVAERAAGVTFAELVRRRVCDLSGMANTAFLRSDELPGDAARGYLSIEGMSRTNVFHLPVLGSGDGGLYSTATDIHRLWAAFFAGRVVPLPWVERMVRSSGEVTGKSMAYGLGFWLRPAGHGVLLEGSDAGVSFRSEHRPESVTTWTAISNISDGAWPLARFLSNTFND